MNLNPLQIDRLAADGLAHFDAITRAVLPIRRGQVHQGWSELAEQRVWRKVCSEAPRAQDDWTALAVVSSSFLIHQAGADPLFDGERVRTCLCDDASHFTLALLSDLLDHLDQSVCDRHSWEALFPPVRSWC